MMCEPHDYNSDMKALRERAQSLKMRKVQQLGDLVIATGADVLPVEQFDGALPDAVETRDAVVLKNWSGRGDAFFRSRPRCTAREVAPDDGSTKPTGGDAGTP